MRMPAQASCGSDERFLVKNYRDYAPKKVDQDANSAIRLAAFELSKEIGKRATLDPDSLAVLEWIGEVQRSIGSHVLQKGFDYAALDCLRSIAIHDEAGDAAR